MTTKTDVNEKSGNSESWYAVDEQGGVTRPEDVRLVSAVNSLLGYATTCKEQNTEDWMDGLLRRINATLEQIGADDRVATFKDGFQVITPADVHETSGPE